MIRIGNFGGFLILIYIWYHHTDWTLLPNTTNVLSGAVITLLNNTPKFLIGFFFLYLIIIFLKNLIMNTRGLLLYCVTLILFHIVLCISLNYLMLENTTTFFLFKIQHPIPLEHYIQHLYYSINNIISENLMLNNEVMLILLKEFLAINVDYSYLQTLNAYQIEQYAAELCQKFNLALFLDLENSLCISGEMQILGLVRTIITWLGL